MIKAFQEINLMKMSALGDENLYDTAHVKPEKAGGESADAEGDGQVNAEFGMTFTVPKVCLTLKTRKKAFTKKIKSSSTEWELKTELEQIDFKMHQGD